MYSEKFTEEMESKIPLKAFAFENRMDYHLEACGEIPCPKNLDIKVDKGSRLAKTGELVPFFVQFHKTNGTRTGRKFILSDTGYHDSHYEFVWANRP